MSSSNALFKNGITVEKITEPGIYTMINDDVVWHIPYLIDENGTPYIEGELKTTKNDTYIETVSYSKGLKNGRGERFYDNGQLQLFYTFKEDILDGPFALFKETGTKQTEGSFAKGAMNGACLVYDEKGDLSFLSTYVNGKLDGEATAFYPKSLGGAIAKKTLYKDGSIIEETSYNLDGCIHSPLSPQSQKT